MTRAFAGFLATALAGLLHAPMASAAPTHPAPAATVSLLAATQPVTMQVFLPLRDSAALDNLLEQQQSGGSASYHKWLTPQQFGAQFGPTSASFAQAETVLVARGFRVTATHTRSFEVTAPAAIVQNTIGTPLAMVRYANGSSRVFASTTMTLPAQLKSLGAVVAQFSSRPALHSNARLAVKADPLNRYSVSGGYWFTDLKQAYDYPSYQSTVDGKPLDGTGVNVAVVISNDVLDSDIAAVFNHEKFTAITGKPAPTVQRVAIDGGAPFDVNASFESSLDVQQVLGGAPGSDVTLINLPDLSDTHIIDGYVYVIESNQYDIVNSSFGGCELFYTAAYNNGVDYTAILSLYDDLFRQGNAQGITFVASSGDEGGLSCPDTNYFAGTGPSRFVQSVQFPSDSPHVTGVGGGNLLSAAKAAPSLTSSYASENGLGDPEIAYDPYGVGANVAGGFWGAGGGTSFFFDKPNYQTLVSTSGSPYRSIPDIGMQVGGCPGGIALLPCGPNRSYVIIALGGSFYGVIGTSVSSPEFVGAVALYIQKEGGRVGNLNTYLYGKAAQQNAGGAVAYNRPTLGYDGKFLGSMPSSQYSFIFGNGTPQVRVLFGFSDLAAAGDPQTASNP